jgi:sensor c-di-GMP phosphodiesterase-like protein
LEARIFKFLRQYRGTPHTSTGYTPFQLLFGREPATTKHPQVNKPNLINKQIEENARQNDETAKYIIKRQFDERNHTNPCHIQIENSVLRKTDRKENKHTPAYEPNPYTVTNKKRNMITVTNGNGLVTRNSSKFKKVNRPSIRTTIDELEDEEKISETKSLNQEKEPPSQIVQRPVREKRAPKYLQDYVRKV